MKKICAVTFSLCFIMSVQSHAWGKRGHEIISSVAAEILVEKKSDHYLKSLEFDLGYYANVPDIIWRGLKVKGAEAGGKFEDRLHYIDWNDKFVQLFKDPKNLPVEFIDYKRRMGADYKAALGLVPWRIHDMIGHCKKIRESLASAGSHFQGEQVLQGKLLVCIGTLSHYTADISQPLHVTDNYDGQMSNQAGIHSYFETALVDALDPELKALVLQETLKQFSKIQEMKLKGDELVRFLINESHGHLAELLKLDKENDKRSVSDDKSRYEEIIVGRMAQGAVVTALIWDEILGDLNSIWNSHKFYFFDGKPDYLPPTFEGSI